MVEEVNNARVWAGIHFRGDMTAGNQVGDRLAASGPLRLSIWMELPVRTPTARLRRAYPTAAVGPYYNPFYQRK